jgi:hypothetical protein
MPVTYVPVSVADAATYTVLARNAGLVHYLPNLTADTVITLPDPAAGLWFEFVYAGVAADAQDWLIDTGSDTNYFVGGVLHLDSDANDAGDELVPVYPDGDSNSKMTVLTPGAGTRVRVESANGTTWVVSGQVVSATAPSFANQ